MKEGSESREEEVGRMEKRKSQFVVQSQTFFFFKKFCE